MKDGDTPATTKTARPTAPTRLKEETARLGDEIYERDIRHKVEADHHGEIVSSTWTPDSGPSATTSLTQWRVCGRSDQRL